MKIVNILGGLGNQMFEYAMFLALKHAHPEEEIKVCTRSFGGYRLHNGLEIQRIFGVELPEASLWDLCKLAYPFFNYKSWQFVRHCLPSRKTMTRGALNIPFIFSEIDRPSSTYYEGYWQNEKNFRHIRQKVLREFSFPPFNDIRNIQLSERILNCESLSCHIRRGDYLKNLDWSVCSMEYYDDAMAKMFRDHKIDLVCLFSDDIEWCRSKFGNNYDNREIVYVDWNKGLSSYCDMQLISLCKYNIIANSSFSWWGAWLGRREGKVVYAPDRWLNAEVLNSPICDSWVKIHV